MKTYTKNAMNLVSNPTLLVTTCIGGTFITAQLQELPTILKADNLSGYRPMGTTVEGVKNGIFPVLSPKTLAASLALKVKGYDVPLGDGLSCVSQKVARDIAKALKDLGVQVEDLAFEWMVGQPQGATKAQQDEAKPQTNHGQPTIEEQLADSPF
jgi:hypothetical protein